MNPKRRSEKPSIPATTTTTTTTAPRTTRLVTPSPAPRPSPTPERVSRPSAPPEASVTCYNCYKLGHYASFYLELKRTDLKAIEEELSDDK